MKNCLTILSLVLSSYFVSAQETPTVPEANCYNKWAAKFEERGADHVEDGTYTDVIVTRRQGAAAECYSGKAEVKDGKVIHFYVMLGDGTYEEVKKSWKNNSFATVPIVNGISKTMITIHNELYNVLWTKKIRPKKALPVRAPDPTDD